MEDLSYIDNKTLTLIVAAIRKSFTFYSEEYQKVLDKSSVRTGPRNGKKYICNNCKKEFDRKNIDVDHKDPCIPVDKSVYEMDLKTLYYRIRTTEENLRVLCKYCHKIKSINENKLRKHFRDLKPKIKRK